MKINVLRGVSALLLLGTFSVFSATSQYPCDKKIVQAVTSNNEKEVRICLSRGGVSYTQSRVGEASPEIDIRAPVHKARFEHNRYFQTLEIDYGKYRYTYEFFPEMDIRKRLTGEIVINDIFIYHDEHPIEALHLPKETKHDISPALSKAGLKNITGYWRK